MIKSLSAYLYIRTLSMNRKLEAARRAVEKMSQVKSSFIQHKKAPHTGIDRHAGHICDLRENYRAIIALQVSAHTHDRTAHGALPTGGG